MTSFHSPPSVPWMGDEPDPIEIIVPIFTVVKSSVQRQCTYGRSTVRECHRETNFMILVTTDELDAAPLCPQHIAYFVEEGLKDEAGKTEDKQVAECECSHCIEKVSAADWSFPYCSKCYANVDGRCT